ncbi:HD family hydrolase [Hoeflea sp.]|uniref:HD family hydrolase n=1 Tax=Hoeflea sp. TaxID=1940281 RepID=UPI0019B34933|nr:HD family hydrolase [Hoeflea sp.]MBC7283440.1 HD family hydrolase [Hoeflea sp.]
MASVERSPRAWQRMLSGRRLDLLDPSPLDVEISDIAQGLARVARWNGQTSGGHAFSVAQHSLMVEEIIGRLSDASPETRLSALLHDAPEYVIGDMISPFKSVVGGGYKAVEARLEAAIHIRFGLPPVLPAALKTLIKRADQISAYFEATELAGFDDKEARAFFGPPRGISRDMIDVSPRPADEVQAIFLQRFEAIEAMRRAKRGG